ncbi:MAG: 30S ribosomal protein S8 [bacterium]
MVNSKVANLIIKIKNAGHAGKEKTTVPYSKFSEAILRVLQEKGFIVSFSKVGKKIIKEIEVVLAYENEQPKIMEVKIMSKLSRRIYGSTLDIKPVKNNYGLLVVSTSKGVLSGDDAKKAKVGGELLFKVW